jgi:hypothetical protein
MKNWDEVNWKTEKQIEHQHNTNLDETERWEIYLYQFASMNSEKPAEDDLREMEMREKLDGDGETLGWMIWWERCTIWKQHYCGLSHCRLKWTYCVSEIKLSLWSKNK